MTETAKTIVMLKTDDLVPYSNNAKKHTEKQIEEIAKSIDRFGFSDPVGVWHNKEGSPEIVTGHGAVLAAKKRGIAEVPCVLLDHLTDEERRAFCHVHNQLTLSTDIDYDAIKCDFDAFSSNDFSLEDFGFNPDDFKVDSMISSDNKLNERERTFASYNMHLADVADTEPEYDIPILRECDYLPTKLLGFNYAMTSKDKDAGIHFFIDDYQFERIWQQPERYTDKLREYECVLTPDFSLYTDMNIPVWIWNVYRSRLLGAYWQYEGLNVVPTLQWSDDRSFDFVFKGLPKHSTVAVSTVGVMRSEDTMALWNAGMTEALNQVEPARILLYGTEPDFVFPKDVELISYESFSTSINDRR